MSKLYRINVTLEAYDETVAGTLGDTEFVTPTQCVITTDCIEDLLKRLDNDSNTITYGMPKSV
jgi:hypothetical protein